MKKVLVTLLIAGFSTLTPFVSKAWKIQGGSTVGVSVEGNHAPVIKTVLEILEKDLGNVLDAQVQLCDASQADIVIRTVGKGPREGFSLKVSSGNSTSERE